MAIDTTNTFGAFRLSRERQLPKPEWWIDRFLIRGSVNMLSAQPKVGKSAFAAMLAHATATGGEFFGRRVPQGEVLYLAGERAAQTEDRIRELFDDDPTHIEDVVLVDTEDDRLPHTFKFNDNKEDSEKNTKFIKHEIGCTPSLIIVDTLTSYFEGDVTNPAHMKAFMDGVRRTAKPFNAVALVLHHDTKEYKDRRGIRTGGNSYNGSIQGLARVDSWIRALVRKEVHDPSDPYGQTEIKIVDFELQDDNFGGGFNYCRAVNKQLVDAAPYLKVVDEKRERQKAIMLEVLKGKGTVSESGWIALCKDREDFGTMGNNTFATIRKDFVESGKVEEVDHPTRSDWTLFKLPDA